MLKVTRSDAVWFTGYVSVVLSLVYGFAVQSGWPVLPSLAALLAISAGCSLLCLLSVPETAKLLISAGLSGRDCHRKATDPPTVLAEGTGVAVGFTYAIALTIFVPFLFIDRAGWTTVELKELSMFLAGLLSINSMCFLGFADNVLNLRWRHKLTLPTIAALPVLFVYYTQEGSTYVLLPDVIRDLIFSSSPSLAVNFGPFYYIFLGMLSVFGTNAINILAGLNGLEVGQSIVLAVAMIANVLVQMNRHSWDSWQFNNETIFSLYILVPFLCCSIALWLFNRYPARIFVGDTYCYLAGTVLAVAGILGHCSKTLLLFMLPQVINFLYSVPQLFRVIPCPRHRMPVYVEAVDRVDVSFTDWIEEKTISPVLVSMVTKLKLAKVERKAKKIRFSNLTVINYVLWKIGKPVNEGKLVNFLLAMQVVWILLAFGLRYKAAGLVYTLVD